MDTLIPINVVVGDRTYRVRIEPKDEEVVRKTVKLINDKLVDFKTQFAGKDMQDYIAMVVLWYATQQKSTDEQLPDTSDLKDQMVHLENLLDKALQNAK